MLKKNDTVYVAPYLVKSMTYKNGKLTIKTNCDGESGTALYHGDNLKEMTEDTLQLAVNKNCKWYVNEYDVLADESNVKESNFEKIAKYVNHDYNARNNKNPNVYLIELEIKNIKYQK